MAIFNEETGAPRYWPTAVDPPCTVFLLGAGVNRCLRDHDGLSPPLAKDLFKQALRDRSLSPYAATVYAPLLNFVAEYSRVPVDLIPGHDIGFEAVLGHLDERLRAAVEARNADAERELATLRLRLVQLLASYLQHFRAYSETFRELARAIIARRSTVITLNYDTFLEYELQELRGLSPTHGSGPDWEAADAERQERRAKSLAGEPEGVQGVYPGWRLHDWAPALAYGIEFDQVEVRQPFGPAQTIPRDVYYAHPGNPPDHLKVLKLHGSVNWFRYTESRILGSEMDRHFPGIKERPGKSLLVDYRWGGHGWPQHDGLYLEPLVIAAPPSAKKELTRPEPYRTLYRSAAAALRSCDELVVVGASLEDPDLDTLVQENRSSRLDRVLLANPSRKVADHLRELLGTGVRIEQYPTLEELVWRDLVSSEISRRAPPAPP